MTARVVAVTRHAALLALGLGCSADPYVRYGRVVRRDVDAESTALSRITMQFQPAMLRHAIRLDSVGAAAREVSAVVEDLRARAHHFAGESPPAGLAEPHAGVVATLAQIDRGLDDLAAIFRGCVDGVRVGDSTGAVCFARLDALGPFVSRRLEAGADDLQYGRERIRRLLLSHGVLLPGAADVHVRRAAGSGDSPR